MAVYRNQTGGVIESPVTAKFYEDVIKGLTSSPKYLQSKYFYDAEGDKIFQQIMNLPEYYLTNCEQEIFSQQTKSICDIFLNHSTEFDIVELGAGDATKSQFLLKHLVESETDFTYYPIDISENVIELLETELPKKIPGLKVTGLNGEYFDMIKEVNNLSQRKKIYLFLGSNIGNFTVDKAKDFLTLLHEHISPGDLMLIGFDLKKDPQQILAAYNDLQGVTKEFNLNLLRRINRELGGNFDIEQFEHSPSYNEDTGECNSFLRSKIDQRVKIGDENEITFQENELIHLEISQKYSIEEINSLIHQSGFKSVINFYDSREWFIDAIIENK
ncbi:MAG: L-histidine N(alpha)-methyltransferase [Bacteroidetes bacterium]|nr:L-histidine N(alpha)-methyltransferase [Bacteroidota bacterium]